MGAAHLQGSLWGARTRDYAEIVEPFIRPLYEAVFDAAEVGADTWLLDAGCGPGLAAQLAGLLVVGPGPLALAHQQIVVGAGRIGIGLIRHGLDQARMIGEGFLELA